jgi:predicted DNA-binding transcriptional regulator AlpA
MKQHAPQLPELSPPALDVVPAFVSPKQAAALLGISTQSIWRYEKTGLLHRKRFPNGRSVRYPIGEVLALLEDHPAA